MIKFAKKNFKYILGICLFAWFLRRYYYSPTLDIMNTTVFALSYRYGFISRGVLGTFLDLWNQHSSVDLMSYNTVLLISKMSTYLLLLFAVLFTLVAVYKSKDRNEEAVKCLGLLVLLVTIPAFVNRDNLGRLDVYLVIITFMCLILLMAEKLEWLVVPLVTFATLIHEGYVFMYLNIILAVLFYRCFKDKGKINKKYLVLLILSFALPSVLFLYFEFFSHHFGMDVYNQVCEMASALSFDGTYHDIFLKHEILGLNIYGEEAEFHRWNREDIPVFLVLFSPYIYLIARVFKSFVSQASEKYDKIVNILMLLGPCTLLPEMILKTDFGRYVFAILFYYALLFMFLLQKENPYAEETSKKCISMIKYNVTLSIGLIIYFVLFMPLRSYRICDMVTVIVGKIFGN